MNINHVFPAAWRIRWAFIRQILRTPGQRKYMLTWLRSLSPNYLMEHRMPWMTFAAIDHLKTIVPKNALIFEWGSGGSTLFWLDRAERCISVEHDAQWHQLVREKTKNESRLDYRLASPLKPDAPVSGGDASDPDLYLSDDPPWHGCSFREYAGQIDKFPDGYFDIVSVDGRARPSCIKHAAPKVKVGGILLLDNSDREYYTAKASIYLKDFSCRQFYGPGPCVYQMWQTDFYRRLK